MSSREHDGSKRQSDQATWIVPSAPTAADGSPGSRTGSSRSETADIRDSRRASPRATAIQRFEVRDRRVEWALRVEVDDRDRTVRPDDRDYAEPTRGIFGPDGRAPVLAAVARRGRRDCSRLSRPRRDRVHPTARSIGRNTRSCGGRRRRPTACRRGCREAPARRRPVRRTTREPPSEQPRRRSASESRDGPLTVDPQKTDEPPVASGSVRDTRIARSPEGAPRSRPMTPAGSDPTTFRPSSVDTATPIATAPPSAARPT